MENGLSKSRIIYLPAHKLDNNPIILKLWINNITKPKPFEFELAWTRVQGSKIVIEQAWRIRPRGSWAYIFARRIKETELAMKTWNKNVFGNIEEKITELFDKIDNNQRKEFNNKNKSKEKQLQKQLDE